ncbi:hypothetical protein MIPYR_10651 [uncultured Microbacterium sp.]|uniref:Uncharacterized protein n=1 Tax=uncultured Microbacterium sp. TaxID=191216 RepID=A0A1Y5P4A5_9MICO|nr:hypothetical protein MIPYR_10651 [uncultured Microbacterium sp.]
MRTCVSLPVACSVPMVSLFCPAPRYQLRLGLSRVSLSISQPLRTEGKEKERWGIWWGQWGHAPFFFGRRCNPRLRLNSHSSP